MSAAAVKLERVSKIYKLYDSPKDRLKEALDPFRRRRHRDFFALNRIDLEINKGEILGVVGRNGSGKSTLLKLIAGVILPSSGRLTVHGNVSAMLELGSGLNPGLDGIQNIYFSGLMLGFSREEMKTKMDDIIAFADIGDFIRQPLRTYSSGMKARLGFALAISMKPEILVVDEVLSVGDDLFKRKCFAKMEELFQSGCTVFFVSHSMASVIEICTRAILLDAGEIILEGTPKFIAVNYDRLLFGKPTERDGLRNELIRLNRQKQKEYVFVKSPKIISTLFDNSEPSNMTTLSQDNACLHESIFLPEFQSKSKTIQKTADIDLKDVHLSSLDGQKVNYLFPNEFYYLNYRVRFSEDTEHIVFAFVFKTQKGLVLSGVRYPAAGKTLDKMIKGTVCLVKWKFRCSFLPGDYYLDLGVVEFRGSEKLVLSAEYDALVFRVQDCKCLREKTSSWAYFSIEPEINLEQVANPEGRAENS